VCERAEAGLTPQQMRKVDGTQRAAVPLGIGQAVFLIEQDGVSGRNCLGMSHETPSASHPSTGSPSRWDG
jgi:hypothetical protein